MNEKIIKINISRSDFEKADLSSLTLHVLLYYGTCEEDGEYVPITFDHSVVWKEKRRFTRGADFPDDRGWIICGE